MSSAAATLSPQLPASVDPQPSRNPLEIARSLLIRELVDVQVPPAHAIADIPELIRDVANILDRWLYAVGGVVADQVNVDVDMRVFTGAFLGAIEGNADYEVQCVVERSSQYRTLRRAR